MERQHTYTNNVSNHMPFSRPTYDPKHDPPQYPEPRKHTLPPPETPMRPLDEDRSFKPLALYPPPYQPHDPAMLRWAELDNRELAPIKSPVDLMNDLIIVGSSIGSNAHQTLPSLSSITATSAPSPPPSAQPIAPPTQRQPEPVYSPHAPPPVPPPLSHWPSLNPLTAYYTPSHVQNPDSPMKMDVDTSSTSAVSAASSSHSQDGRASSVSLDDPDVRMAAEALGDLRADFVSSPLHRPTPPRSPRGMAVGQQPEPLLSLLTTSHPFLATTIDSATSAYTNSKNYYPRFKTSIEYVEGCVIPIANTVGSVGRVTGVEDGVRWFLRRTQPHESEHGSEGQGSSKRRKVESGDALCCRNTTSEPGSGAQTPRASFENDRRPSITSTVDTLPAYDELRAPPYDDSMAGSNGRPNGTWPTRLIMSTSALSIAMSEESLRSLKYCLGWIRWANAHIGSVINSLTITMEKYEQRRYRSSNDLPTQHSSSAQELEDRNQLAAKICALRSDVLKTLQEVINTVSRYAGGALPENAREIVRRHLTSLPQRFHLASLASNRRASDRIESNMEQGYQGPEQQEDKETRESARRALLLAKEGLDMMSQVSGVLNGTIVSAEEWCVRLGRKKREQREGLLGFPPVPQPDSKSDETMRKAVDN